MFGLESYVARVKDMWSRVSQGSSLLMVLNRKKNLKKNLKKHRSPGLLPPSSWCLAVSVCLFFVVVALAVLCLKLLVYEALSY